MISVQIKGEVSFPEIKLVEELEEIAKSVFIPRLVGNIESGIDLTEVPYPPLAASTIKKKKDNRVLIDNGDLVASFFSEKRGKDSVVIKIKPKRRNIADILQNKGVRSKQYGLRFFNFFGISTTMETEALKFMERKVKEYADNAK